jgi:hypothetical protein
MTGVASAFEHAQANTESAILLGAVAKGPEIEYCWIEPDSSSSSYFGGPLMRVKRFWESPPPRSRKAYWIGSVFGFQFGVRLYHQKTTRRTPGRQCPRTAPSRLGRSCCVWK